MKAIRGGSTGMELKIEVEEGIDHGVEGRGGSGTLIDPARDWNRWAQN